MEAKEVAVSILPVPQPAVPFQPLVLVAPQASHAVAWQAGVDAAFAAFLQGVNTQLLQAGQLKSRPIVLSYANLPQEETLCLPGVAARRAMFEAKAESDTHLHQDPMAASRSVLAAPRNPSLFGGTVSPPDAVAAHESPSVDAATPPVSSNNGR